MFFAGPALSSPNHFGGIEGFGETRLTDFPDFHAPFYSGVFVVRS
jgi:hypothetical protein